MATLKTIRFLTAKQNVIILGTLQSFEKPN